MPKYQVCPYCKVKYGYKDIVLMKGKIQECRKCKRRFEAKKKYKAIPVVIACVLMLAVNLIFFSSSDDIGKKEFITMVAADAAVILAAFVISPLFVRFSGISGEKRGAGRKSG